MSHLELRIKSLEAFRKKFWETFKRCLARDTKKLNEKIFELEQKELHFCADLQIFIHDYMLSKGERLTFQQIRKAAYDYALAEGKNPQWGDETYMGSHFYDLSSFVERLQNRMRAVAESTNDELAKKVLTDALGDDLIGIEYEKISQTIVYNKALEILRGHINDSPRLEQVATEISEIKEFMT